MFSKLGSLALKWIIRQVTKDQMGSTNSMYVIIYSGKYPNNMSWVHKYFPRLVGACYVKIQIKTKYANIII